VEMVLSGTTNKGLAAALTAAGVPAVGVSGRDGGLLAAEPLPGLGRVGGRVRVGSTAPLEALWGAGLLPVVSPVSGGPDGGAPNVNADAAALGLARGLGARLLVYLSDTDGVQLEGRPVPSLRAGEADARIEDGSIAGGMALKVRVALDAAASGIDVVIAGRARLTGGFPGTRVEAQEVRA